VERQAHVIEARGRNQPKASRHPGLDDDQSPVPGQRDHDPLAAAVHPIDARRGDAPAELVGVTALDQGRVVHRDRTQRPPDRAGRSPRTIVSTSGNSGIGAQSPIDTPGHSKAGPRISHGCSNFIRFPLNPSIFLMVLDKS